MDKQNRAHCRIEEVPQIHVMHLNDANGEGGGPKVNQHLKKKNHFQSKSSHKARRLLS